MNTDTERQRIYDQLYDRAEVWPHWEFVCVTHDSASTWIVTFREKITRRNHAPRLVALRIEWQSDENAFALIARGLEMRRLNRT